MAKRSELSVWEKEYLCGIMWGLLRPSFRRHWPFKIVSESSVSSGVTSNRGYNRVGYFKSFRLIQQSALKDKEQGRQQVIDLQNN